ncbi:glycosyltransferase N-terminal domain-containing protein [Dichotomicrobium thermohalophilum]|uniref:3-deoxy-D-manno-octulosonic acid transferase n=1 Tax=Dichotomicrobium thermohalophilum TaxID=933063 RepID=A0A397PEK5_9HYPH|nr:glycosyltransferase N-terminal domain-containing protein [Dichotomicrobium thermohalophilum]RIA47388.1 3-deoxy-D-manno-octulosonic-acid transferase [Dichotomicrobium thermohalophilum]
MAQRRSTPQALKKALGWFAARYIALVRDTSKVIRVPEDMDRRIDELAPAIFTTWHGQFLMSATMKPAHQPAKMMIARHGDAEVIAQAVRHFDIELIRGAGAAGRRKDRGGATAFRSALGSLQDGVNVAMTADVPPGPARKAGTGVVALASASGRPIIPMGFATRHTIAFRSWSRFTLNLPFSKFAMVMGDPLRVPEDADDEELEASRRDLEQRVNAVTRRAYALAGGSAHLAEPVSAANPERPGLALKTYRLLTRVARPAAGSLLRRRVARGKEIGERLGERFGRPGRTRPPGRLWWFHAASVGETNAILPLMHALRERYPDIRFVLTTFTVTSARIASNRLPEGAVHQFAPLDSPQFVRRFLDYWKPELAAFTESEIWPNLIMETHARGVPMVLVNARMSPRSFKRWRKQPGMSRPLFSRFDMVLAQDQTLARRFMKSGAHTVHTLGNLKADAPAPPVDEALQGELAAALAARPILLAASTHPGEDEIVTEAAERLRARIPDLLTVIVPRHPERGATILEMAKQRGVSAARRSRTPLPGADTELFIADTLGELGTWYAVSPLALIGGSLVPHGGQNPIEAVKLETGVITGPHHENFAQSFEALMKAGGCREVASAQDLADTVAELLADPQALEDMRASARAAAAELQGALERTLAALAPYAEDDAVRPTQRILPSGAVAAASGLASGEAAASEARADTRHAS